MPSDMENEHLILYCAPEESSFYMDYLAPAGVTPRQISQIQLTEAILSMVKEGIGVSVLARWAVSPEVAEGKLVIVPFSGCFEREWRAAYRTRGRVPSHIRSFIDALAEESMGTEFPSGVRRIGLTG